jgi:hypothetical protein
MALLQLAAKGEQDKLLTSNPQTSLFKSTYKRHTPFQTEWVQETINGTATFGQRCTIPIPKTSDLVRNIVLEATMKRTGDTFYCMEEFVDGIELLIGGVKVASYDRTWSRVYDELYRSLDEQMAYREMTDFSHEPIGNVKRLRLPLIFWFCRTTSQALPLISVPYAQVELVLHLNKQVKGIDMTVDPSMSIHLERVFLGPDERRIFARSTLRYLVEQVQMAHSATLSIENKQKVLRFPLDFNHPTKSLVFVLTNPQMHGVFSASLLPLENREAAGPVKGAKLIINGKDVQEEKSGSWLRNVDNFLLMKSSPSVGIYTMHFCTQPQHPTQPSGSLNLSEVESELFIRLKSMDATLMDNIVNIDDETLKDATELTHLYVYGQSWNQLVFSNGMAGITWSN